MSLESVSLSLTYFNSLAAIVIIFFKDWQSAKLAQTRNMLQFAEFKYDN